MTTTLQQQRAADALKKVESIAKHEAKKQGEYVSYANSLPATIVMNGLGQALTTLLAKAKGDPVDAHRLLFDHVAGWLSHGIASLRVPNANDLRPLIQRLMENDQKIYIQAQAEAMAYLTWLKQFARAYLKDDGQGDAR